MTEVRYAGRFRGDYLEVIVRDNSKRPTIRLLAAGLADFEKVIDETAKAFARLAHSINETDDMKAYRAFVNDGGDPEFIHRVERLYGIES